MTLRDAIIQYFDAKDLEETAKTLKSEAVSVISGEMRKIKIDKLQAPNRGTFSLVPEKRGTKTDLDAFKLNLLGAGVGAEVVSDCEKASQKPDNRSEYLTFKPLKKKKES